MSIDSVLDSLSTNANNNEPIIYSLGKAAAFVGLFIIAMNTLEAYMGTGQTNFPPYPHDQSEDSDSSYELADRVTIPVTPLTILEEVQVALEIETVEAVSEEDEENPIYVIGAEDAVDDLNRKIGY